MWNVVETKVSVLAEVQDPGPNALPHILLSEDEVSLALIKNRDRLL